MSDAAATDKPFIRIALGGKNALSPSECTLLTGIRRGGKTFLLHELIAKLKAEGVDERRIIYLDFENFVFPEVSTQRELSRYLRERIETGEKYYVFLDEIGTVSGWEKALSPLLESSNAVFFAAVSGGRAEKKAGKKKPSAKRWAERRITPLSYSEYREWEAAALGRAAEAAGAETARATGGLLKRALSLSTESALSFERYVARGGFPATLEGGAAERKARLADIYSAILYHDLLLRKKIKNRELLENVIKYLFEHIGEECQASRLATLLRRGERAKNGAEVAAILRHLESAQLIQRLRGLNLANMRTLNARSKYFIGDHALFYAVSGAAGVAEHGILENIVVNELSRRGYELYSGKIERHIIDFVGRSGNKTLCVQTLLRGIEGEEAAEKKYEALARVPRVAAKLPLKYVVFCDKTREAAMRTAARALDAKDGVLFMSLPDFLQSDTY